MTNYDGIRVHARHDNYIVSSHEKFYYFDWGYRLRGPYDTREDAIVALKKEWEDHEQRK